MENRFKMKISRMFKSSFGSCKSKNICDDIDNNNNNKPVFNPQHYQLLKLFSPKPRPSSAMFTQQTRTHSVGGVRRNAASVYCHNSTCDTNGRECPPASPILPPHEYNFQEKCNFMSMTKKNSEKKKKLKKMTNSRIKRFEFDQEFSSFNYKGLFSSDEEGEEYDNNTLFSSRSLTTNSDSSEYSLRRKPQRRRRTASGGVKGSLAVVKKSSDPYSDFRDSMLEMIMENQIFGSNDLENLLECFLSLNSQHHHSVIIGVFIEICESLF